VIEGDMSHRISQLGRRAFLRTAGVGLVVLPSLDLGRLGLPRPTRPARVAVVHTADRRDGVRRAMGLLDLRRMAGRHVVLKPNFNSADPAPAATSPETLAQLVAEIHGRGARRITVGESSGPQGTARVMAANGVHDMARDLGFDVVDYDEIADEDWIRFGPEGTHWPDGFSLPRHVVEAEYNVATCCLKTHGYGGVFTMALKLTVGLTPRSIRRPLHQSPDMRRMIAELNLGYRPDVIVLDGVTAFTDGGPSRGEEKRGDVVIAGHDPVAVDVVGLAALKRLGSNAAIMDTPVFEQEQIARAVELGLGVDRADLIDLVTPDAASRAYADELREFLAR
jgi:uncharacterized protein (DUF362 family)